MENKLTQILMESLQRAHERALNDQSSEVGLPYLFYEFASDSKSLFRTFLLEHKIDLKKY